jgi:hypothetical protein
MKCQSEVELRVRRDPERVISPPIHYWHCAAKERSITSDVSLLTQHFATPRPRGGHVLTRLDEITSSQEKACDFDQPKVLAMTSWKREIEHAVRSVALVTALVISTGGTAYAQAASQAASQARGQAAAAPEITAAQAALAGEEVVKLVDQSRFADLWNSASLATQKVARQSQFNSDLVTNRQPLGAPTSRSWIVIARQTLGTDKGAIAGQYLSVEYETRFTRGDVKHELVSFRFDEDRVWRFAGYVLR